MKTSVVMVTSGMGVDVIVKSTGWLKSCREVTTMVEVVEAPV